MDIALELIFAAISLLILAMELYTGFAIIGWTGDYMVVDRRKAFGPYVFAVTLHALILLGVPLLIYLARQ